jgi:membrane-associated protein
VGILRALVPAVAGITRMPYRRFLAANVAGGVLWVVGVLAIGYAAGGSVMAAQQMLGNLTTLGLVATVLGIGYAVVRSRRRRVADAAPAQGGDGPNLSARQPVADADNPRPGPASAMSV